MLSNLKIVMRSSIATTVAIAITCLVSNLGCGDTMMFKENATFSAEFEPSVEACRAQTSYPKLPMSHPRTTIPTAKSEYCAIRWQTSRSEFDTTKPPVTTAKGARGGSWKSL